jgi:fatty-acyl-CoA synthase
MSRRCWFNEDLAKNPANCVPLSPLSFLKRASTVYANRVSLVYNTRQYSWRETYSRCSRLASALTTLGVQRGDTVATMLPNVPAIYEAHFGIPMVGAVINAINIRLDAEAIAFILSHSHTRVLLVDPEFHGVVKRAFDRLEGPPPIVIDVLDSDVGEQSRWGNHEYEQLLGEADNNVGWHLPADEWDAIALGYTSGTTGNPKGVVSHHRGAYLNAVSNVLSWNLPENVTYLWTLPMFHCNGWCFPWTMAVIGGTNICLRRIDPDHVVELIQRHQVTHYCGAPIVHSMIAECLENLLGKIGHKVSGLIAGAAPSAALLEKMEYTGIELTHVYGLTETYGPATVCLKQPVWSELPRDRRAELNGRQGVTYPLEEEVAVLDPVTLQPVPANGSVIGEVMFKGNIVMKGYLRNPKATAEAFSGGWFRSGDLAVVQPDGYIKLRDRSKDVIISGGENIYSMEVEEVILRHPDIELAAVVAAPDAKWGEVPVAFVQLQADSQLSEAELIRYCRDNIAHFKAPKRVYFEEIPVTSTGKIQKYSLRQRLSTTR